MAATVLLHFCGDYYTNLNRSCSHSRLFFLLQLFEIGLPVFMLSVLLIIKNNLGNDGNAQRKIVEPTFPADSDAFIPLTFADYVTALRAVRTCVNSTLPPVALTTLDGQEYALDATLTGMPFFQFDWQVPFVRCDASRCNSENRGHDNSSGSDYCEYQILAVAPSSLDDAGGQARAEQFQQFLFDEYPALDPSTNTSLPFDYPFVQMFNSSDAINDYVRSPTYGRTGFPKLAFAIVWTGNGTDRYQYALRQNSTLFNVPISAARPVARTTPDTRQLLDSFANTDDNCWNLDGGGTPFLGTKGMSCTGQYLYNGVLTMHTLVGDFILHDAQQRQQQPNRNATRVSRAGVRFVSFPTRRYEKGGIFSAINGRWTVRRSQFVHRYCFPHPEVVVSFLSIDYAPLLVTLGFLYPIAAIIGYICTEKESRQKELMKMMSVTESDIGWSWFVTFFGMHLITVILITWVASALYENSGITYLFIFWLFSFLSMTVFSMALSILTSKATRAVLIGLCITLIGVFLTFPVSYATGSPGIISLISFHPVAAFAFGLQVIGELEDGGVGLQSSTVGETDNPSGLTFNSAVAQLMLDSVVWGVVTWYANRVSRPEYGQALPFYFPFMLSYWHPNSKKVSPSQVADTDSDVGLDIPVEAVGEDRKRQTAAGESIEIRKLRKVFGDKVAVDDLSLSIFKGTTLLSRMSCDRSPFLVCLLTRLTLTLLCYHDQFYP
jgi:ABC-2 family transporter protein